MPDPSIERTGFFLSHLLGHYSLARSFWLHTVLLGWLFSSLTAYLTARLVDSYPVRYSSLAALVLVPTAFALWAWSNVGAFAAATRRLLSGRGWFWSLVAMLLLFMGAREAVPELRTLRPFLSEHFTVAMGAQPGEPFTVTLVDAGKTVEFVGLSTTVKDECASACTIAFLAGLDRTASQGAILGFHSARPVGGLLASKGLDRRDERTPKR